MSPPRALLLLRSLIPSWRFFEKPQAAARLEVQAGDGPWMDFLPAPERPRGALSVVWNARGNLELACHGLIDQLLSELDSAELERSVSYALVRNLAAARAREAHGAGTRFRFRIIVDGEDALLSPEHEA